MKTNENAIQAVDRGVFRSNEPERERLAGVRVEPCQFEALLERAMEILSVRARSATPSSS